MHPPAGPRLAGRLLAIPVVVALLAGGVWVTGGLVTDDFTVATALTTAWILLLGGACLAVARRRRPLALPVVGTYLVASLLAGGYLGMSVLFDKTVDEDVVTAEAPAARAPAATAASAAERARRAVPPAAPRNVLLGRAQFQSVSHAGSGIASAIDRARGGDVLTLTRLDVENGPDLRVLLVSGRATGSEDLGDRRDLGALKGNKGNQQYTIPSGLDLGHYDTVVIWCRAFSVNFARARLRSA